MTPHTILAALSAAGLAVTLSGDHMEYRLLVSPRHAITDQHRALIAAHRDGLIALLYSRAVDAAWPVVPATPAIRRAATPWPEDAKAGLLPSTSHYRYTEDVE